MREYCKTVKGELWWKGECGAVYLAQVNQYKNCPNCKKEIKETEEKDEK